MALVVRPTINPKNGKLWYAKRRRFTYIVLCAWASNFWHISRQSCYSKCRKRKWVNFRNWLLAIYDIFRNVLIVKEWIKIYTYSLESPIFQISRARGITFRTPWEIARSWWPADKITRADKFVRDKKRRKGFYHQSTKVLSSKSYVSFISSYIWHAYYRNHLFRPGSDLNSWTAFDK